MEKLKAILKANWKFVLGLAVAAGTIGGVLTFRKGERFEIIVVLPDDAPDVFNDGQPPVFGTDAKLSERAKRALRMGGGELRRRDGERVKLFAVLRSLHNDPAAFERIEAAAKAAPQMDPMTLALIAKIAIQVAIVVLERVAPNTPNEWDDRLLLLLKLFGDNPAAVDAAHAAL